MPAAEHCHASVRYPGRAEQRRERSCQPLPQLALHACHRPNWTRAMSEASIDWPTSSETSEISATTLLHEPQLERSNRKAAVCRPCSHAFGSRRELKLHMASCNLALEF